jgi:hypothetical protein
MRIFDCFTFYNEFDLLEIRLEELYNTVDHFVLVEANQTFTNRAKPFLFDENKERYARFLDKIIHIKVDDMPGNENPWVNEVYQRNAIMRGLVDAIDNDIAIVSDCDEVLRASAVESMRSIPAPAFALRMPLFNFKFNYMRTTPGQYDAWAMAARMPTLRANSPDLLRNQRFNLGPFSLVEHAGWHFGYLGDREFLIDKAKSFSHQEVNTPEFFAQLDIDASIKERKEWNRSQSAQYDIVELDDYFPRFLLDNQERFAEFILNDPVTTVNKVLQ